MTPDEIDALAATFTPSELDDVKGKTVVAHCFESGYVIAIFADNTFVKLEPSEYYFVFSKEKLDARDLRLAKLITQDEYMARIKHEESLRAQELKEYRRKKYEELKKEFEP
jgi:hypothetical protein